MAVYDLGDVVSLGITIKNAAGSLANATQVVATITTPDGSTYNPTVVNTSTGLYDISYTPATSGRYVIRWVATGSNASAYSDDFTVRNYDQISIVSLDEVKSHLNIAVDTHDEEIRRFIDAATDLCQNYVGSILGRDTFVSEKYDGNTDIIRLRNPRALSITSIYENGTLIDPTQYMLDPTGQRVQRLSVGSLSGPNYFGVWAPGVQNIVISYISGFINPPPSAKQGLLEEVRHLWQTQRGSTNVMGRGQSGDEYMPGTSFSMPLRVMELLDPIRLPGIA